MALAIVRAVSYETMAAYLADPRAPTDSCAALAAKHDRVWIVSVTNSRECPLNVFEGWDDDGPAALVTDTEDRLALSFDDIEPVVDRETGAELRRDTRFVYFDGGMAERVCAFVHRAHATGEESRDVLLVNCHAGVSRSGAIADFARTVAGVDYESFRRLNPQVVPNTFVRRMLFDTWLARGLPVPAGAPSR